MNELAKEGKQRTKMILIGISIFYLYGVLYGIALSEYSIMSMISGGIKYLLLLGLFAEVYKGKKWAKILTIIISILGIYSGAKGFVMINDGLLNKVPFMITAGLYIAAFYHLAFSESYKAFYEYQNRYED